MKSILLILWLPFMIQPVMGQQKAIDSLKRELALTQNDTLRLVLYSNLNTAYNEINPDSALYYGQKYLIITQQLNYKINEAEALAKLSYPLMIMGNHAKALSLLFKSLKIVESTDNQQDVPPPYYLQMLCLFQISDYKKNLHFQNNFQKHTLGCIHLEFGIVYLFYDDEKQIAHYFEAEKIAKSINATDLLIYAYLFLGTSNKYQANNIDSALIYLQKARNLALNTGLIKHLGSIYSYMSYCYHKKGNHLLELDNLRAAVLSDNEQDNTRFVGSGYIDLATFYNETNTTDSVIYYAQQALKIGKTANFPELRWYSSEILKNLYKLNNNLDSAFKYQEMMISSKDSMFNSDKIRQFKDIDFDEKLQQHEIERTQEQLQNKIKVYILFAASGVFLIIAFILWRTNLQKQKSKVKIEKAYSKLESTQAQLIQSEKLASLGALTAGIAHEIQNPLNFVNNFSEVNKELLVEMKDEIDKGNIDEVKGIANNIIDNEEKINHHGKRADAIVKGMLQHSRAKTGQKEPTDINVLADEYLRLSYHGSRAKDKDFNATLQTDFDISIEKISVIPQDIGSVLLNLFTNAFYSVTEKKKQASEEYEPIVSVSTKKMGNKVEIRVKDNGLGIPQKVLDKIFQPFFTTKPTGQGTGLGLSLSYDIIKAHGGEIKVETKESEGVEFVILLS
jgi:two-component system NtrC family sensor kinase